MVIDAGSIKEKEEGITGLFMHILIYSRMLYLKTVKLANLRAGRTGKGKAECKVQAYTRKLH